MTESFDDVKGNEAVMRECWEERKKLRAELFEISAELALTIDPDKEKRIVGIRRLSSELAMAKEQLAQAQACCADCRQVVLMFWRDLTQHRKDRAEMAVVGPDIARVLSTDCGQSLLDERDRYQKALAELRNLTTTAKEKMEKAWSVRDMVGFVTGADWLVEMASKIISASLEKK